LIVPTLILNETVVPPEDGKIYGIHTATQEWLHAYVHHIKPAELHFRANTDAQADIIVILAAKSATPIALKRTHSLNDVAHCAFYMQLPEANQFWARHWQTPHAYSICGLNHSLSGSHIYDQLRALFLAPTEQWDALICSSQASRNVITTYMEAWSEFLASRSGSSAQTVRPPLQLPVIPMGTDTSAWATTKASGKRGTQLRAKLNIMPGDIAVLFLGRLNFSSKAHPWPMLQALREAKAQTNKKIHLLQAGWYPAPEMEKAMNGLVTDLAPGIVAHHLPASTNEERLAAYAAADIFMSLSDNIQESFGLTLVEAMACGLPVIASDWDGYRDTIVNGETGFLVPTLMAPPDTGADLGIAHGLGTRVYNRYLLDVGQGTAVSANAAREALLQLINDADLRRRMGEAGRRRAVEKFDWSVIVKAHTELWAALETRRKNSSPVHAHRNPHFPDPFALFQDFATGKLSPQTTLALTENWKTYLPIVMQSPIMRNPTDWLAGDAAVELLLQKLRANPGIEAGKLLEGLNLSREHGVRTIVWLIKGGVILPSSFKGF
jgi:starch synthase